MKVTLQSTSEIRNFEGVNCRLWEGETEGSIACFALIPVIAHAKDDDDKADEFRRDLEQLIPPSGAAVHAFDFRQFVD